MENRKQLKIYNTLSGKKEDFVPLEPGKAGMYVCGVTVYGECHLGHARAYVSFDVIKRYLRYRGFDVTHIQNFTDVDDKIIEKARELRDETVKHGRKITLSEACREVSERYTMDYFAQMDRLNIERASEYPRATEHIQEMVGIIKALLEKGFAYRTESGVYFSIGKFGGYGKLSGRDTEGMRAGARVDSREDKQHPLDFALWKKTEDDEPFWDSPFGRGRPGWHIECSAMSMKYLGETFDIHGGGADLVFPHNENEIAQSEALTGKPLASYWVHNGFVTVENDKMSKSLGNFTTARQALERFTPEAVRLFFLSAHYRSPLDFNTDELENAGNSYRRLAECDRKIASYGFTHKKTKDTSPVAKKFLEEFENHMDNDFNTPGALAAVFGLARHINSKAGREDISGDAGVFIRMRETLGIPAVLEKPGFVPAREIREEEAPGAEEADELIMKGEELSDAGIKRLILRREFLRKNKKWQEADALRDRLGGIVKIKDTKEGVSWERLKVER